MENRRKMKNSSCFSDIRQSMLSPGNSPQPRAASQMMETHSKTTKHGNDEINDETTGVRFDVDQNNSLDL